MAQLRQGSADPKPIMAFPAVSLRLLQKLKDSLTVGLYKSGVFDGETISPQTAGQPGQSILERLELHGNESVEKVEANCFYVLHLDSLSANSLIPQSPSLLKSQIILAETPEKSKGYLYLVFISSLFLMIRASLTTYGSSRYCARVGSKGPDFA